MSGITTKRRWGSGGASLLRLWVLLSVILLISGCSQPQPDDIRFGLAQGPVTLDPRFATDAASARINRLLYRQLVEFGPDFSPVAGIAQWQQLDARRYRFELNEAGRLFSDGSRLTAADVAATYNSLLQVDSGSPHRGGLDMIREIEVIDENHLDFYLSRNDPLFPGRLTIGILPAAAIAAAQPFNQSPIGSGPFEFSAWPEPGVLQIKRRADGQTFSFITVQDPTVRVVKLLNRELDLLQNDLPPELVDMLDARAEIDVVDKPGSNFSYLGLSLADPLTGNLKLRRAIAHGIDRQTIIDYLWHGRARPAEGLLPPRHWASPKNLPAYDYDPELARQLVAEINPGGKPLELSYKLSNVPLRLRIAAVIQQQLGAIGIDLKLQTYEWGTFYGDIKAGRFQLFSLAWVGVKNPDIFRYVFHSDSIPPAGANRGRLRDARLDALIESAEQAPDLASQANGFQAVQRRAHDLLPYIPLWYEHHVVAMRQEIAGYTLAADGNYDGLEQTVRRNRDAD
ncbi:MAG: ABC transporter substrate-binding protein [Gammaproteobacteria bacterium]|nr:ABC transporter substrate-binding protein [Gammaproteobacteria bacterium]